MRIFIDFWSLQITWNEYHQRRGNRRQVRIPWAPRLYEVLVGKVAEGAVYAGTHVYASYAPGMRKDTGLRRFFNVMDGFTGYDVFVKERAPVSAARCPHPECRQLISFCPHCDRSNPAHGGEGDRHRARHRPDPLRPRRPLRLRGAGGRRRRPRPRRRVPGNRGKQVVHAWFRGQSQELRNACWSHVLFDELIPDLLR